MNNTINVVLKPTEACNLRCKYCYNSDSDYAKTVLPIEKTEKLLLSLCKNYTKVNLIWHGGEPLLVGKEYFERAVKIEEKLHLLYNTEINNDVQTNGTLIDGEWAKFFKKYRFGVGLSFDGKDNDKYRQSADKALRAFDILKKHDVHFACMAVVADDGYDLEENYEFFKRRGVPVIFSPMFAEGGGKALSGVTAEKFADKTVSLFDRWLFDTDGVNNRTFSAYIGMALGASGRICTNGSCLGKWLCITPNGDLYNCGRAGMTEFPYGNIDDIDDADGDGNIEDITAAAFKSPGFVALLRGSIERRNKCKSSNCEYFDYCAGGCPDNAMIEGGLAEPPEFSCACFKKVFGHIKRVTDDVITNKQTPLSELNPAVKQVIIKCLTECGGQDKKGGERK